MTHIISEFSEDVFFFVNMCGLFLGKKIFSYHNIVQIEKNKY